MKTYEIVGSIAFLYPDGTERFLLDTFRHRTDTPHQAIAENLADLANRLCGYWGTGETYQMRGYKVVRITEVADGH